MKVKGSTEISGNAKLSKTTRMDESELKLIVFVFDSSKTTQASLESSAGWSCGPEIASSLISPTNITLNIFILDALRANNELSISIKESDGYFNHLIDIRTGNDGNIFKSNGNGVEQVYSKGNIFWEFANNPLSSLVSFSHEFRYPHPVNILISTPSPASSIPSTLMPSLSLSFTDLRWNVLSILHLNTPSIHLSFISLDKSNSQSLSVNVLGDYNFSSPSEFWYDSFFLLFFVLISFYYSIIVLLYCIVLYCIVLYCIVLYCIQFLLFS